MSNDFEFKVTIKNILHNGIMQDIYTCDTSFNQHVIMQTHVRLEKFVHKGKSSLGMLIVNINTVPENIFKCKLPYLTGEITGGVTSTLSETEKEGLKIKLVDSDRVTEKSLLYIYMDMIASGYTPTHVLGERCTGIATATSSNGVRKVVLPVERRVLKLINSVYKNKPKKIINMQNTNNGLIESYVKYKELFDQSECELIKKTLIERYSLTKAIVSENLEDTNIRSAQRTSIDDNTCPVEIELRRRVIEFINVVNKKVYKFDLDDIEVERFQFIEYTEGSHYDWHMDIGTGLPSRRKLSVVIQLSDPNDYTGGNLELIGSEENPDIKEQGTAIAFPSFEYHRVTPLKTGKRYAIVFWMHGKPFS